MIQTSSTCIRRPNTISYTPPQAFSRLALRFLLPLVFAGVGLMLLQGALAISIAVRLPPTVQNPSASFLPASAIPAANFASAPIPTSGALPLHVCPVGSAPDCDYHSVQAAVDAAQSGDVILVAQGTYTGVTPRTDPHLGGPIVVTQTVYVNKSVTILGGYTTTNWIVSYPLTQPTILDAQGQGRVMYIVGAADVTVMVEGFSITNGFTSNPAGDSELDYGGGIFVEGGNHTIRGNWIYSNTAEVRGGGMYINLGGTSSPPFIHTGNTLVQGNWIYSNTTLLGGTDPGGGGVYIRMGSSLLQNNRIFSNTAFVRGGGIFIYGDEGDSTLVENNYIYGNATSSTSGGGHDGGGGIFIYYKSSAIIRGNSIYSNIIGGFTDHGAGIHIFVNFNPDIALVTVERNAIHHNTEAQSGGGIFIDGKYHVVRNNLIYDNSAENGAGIYHKDQGGTIENNTVFGNVSTAGATGGIYNQGGGGEYAAIYNNIVVSNTGNGIGGGSALLSPTVNYNDAWANTLSDYAFSVSATNISSDPLFAAAASDFSLQPGSPAIDAANPIDFPIDDNAGRGRPFGDGPDMGALEVYTGTCFARIWDGAAYTRRQVYPSVQAAVDASQWITEQVNVAGVCDDVFVYTAEETFTQTVYISKGINLRGGFSPTDWTEPITQTILDAQGLSRVIYITGSQPVTLDGFVVRGGSAITGGGVYLAAPLTSTLQNVVFYNNTANAGGGLASEGGNPRLFNNSFVSNTAVVTGGGLYLAAGSAAGSAAISNTIVVSNIGGGIVAAPGVTSTLAYNDVWANIGAHYVGVTPGATDVSVDPRFVDAPAADFHLSFNSPLIHAGDPATSVRMDLEGDDRPQPEARLWYDIGADESTSYPDVSFSPNDYPLTEGKSGQVTVYTYTLVNAGSLPDTYNLTHTAHISAESAIGWSFIYSASIYLQPGEIRQVPVSIQVGTVTSYTFTSLIVTATSQTNPKVQAAVGSSTFVNSGPAMSLTPAYADNLNPGAVITYSHRLLNAGNITDVYTVTWSRLPNWSVVDIQLVPTHTTIFTLGPGLSTTLSLPVHVLAKAPGGLVETVIMTALSTVSETMRAVVTNTFSVNYVPGTRYVATQTGRSDDALNNCLMLDSASPPCKTIAYAVDQATNIDTIKVAEGVYSEYDISLNKNVKLIGGFRNGNFDLWDPQLYPTLVDAAGQGRILYIFGSPTVQAFTLQGGRVNGSGGAVYIAAGSPILELNTIYSNSATVNGGGVYVGMATPRIRQNTIVSNSASSYGGGLYYNNPLGGNPTWERNVLALNTAQRGGGYAHIGGNPNFWNNLVYSNTAQSDGGGLFVLGGAPRIWHDTFFTNTAGAGGGLYLAGGSPLVSNTIVVTNAALTAGGIYSAAANALLDYNDVWSNTGGDAVGLTMTAPSLSVDPVFRDAAAYGLGLRLGQTSSLRDAGQPGPVTNDFWGDPRPVPANGAPDIGADEFLLAVLDVSPGFDGAGLPGQTVSYTHVLTNSGNYADVIALTTLSSQGWSAYVTPATLSLGVNATGTVVVDVVIPPDSATVSGTLDTTVLTATSGNDNVWASAADTTLVGRVVSATLDPDHVGLASSGQLAFYTHTLTNLGNYTDTFDLVWSSHNGYAAGLSATSVTLRGGDSVPITLTLLVSSGAPTTTPAVVETTLVTATSRATASVSDVVRDTTYINRAFGASLTPSQQDSGSPDQTVTYTHVLSNSGNYTDTFDLTTYVTYTPSTYPQDWLPGLSPAQPVEVGGGMSRTITLTIGIPRRTLSDTAMLSGTLATTVITATSQFTPALTALVVDATTVQQAQALELTPASTQDCLASPSQPVVLTYTHRITNTGNYTDSFTISAASSNDYAVTSSPETLSNLGPDQSAAVVVSVTLPASPGVPYETLILTATSQSNPVVTQVASDTVSFSGLSSLTWSPPSRQTIVSELGDLELVYTHTLTYNSGSIPSNTITFDRSRNPHTPGWPEVAISPSSLVVNSGDSKVVTLTLGVPAGFPNNPIVNAVDNLVVTATTQLGCEAQPVNIDTLVQRPHVNLLPDASQVGSAVPGASIQYVRIVSNTGGLTDTYHVVYAGDDPTWSVNLTPTDIYTLAPMSGAPVTVTIGVPAGVYSDTPHTLVITASSSFNPAVFDVTTDYSAAAYAPDALLTSSAPGQVDPGKTITYTHSLTNLGNYTDTFILTARSDFGASEVTPDQVTLAPNAGLSNIKVVVLVPDYAAGGEVENTQLIATFASGQQEVVVDSTTVNYVAGTRYVAPNGTDLHNNCADPGFRACATVQHAIDQSAPGDEVHVAQGTYAETLVVMKSLALAGGYTASDWNAAPQPAIRRTILDARQAGRVISVTGDAAVTVDGFTLTGGAPASGDGGALYFSASRPLTLSNSIIYANSAANGGALYIDSVDAWLYNNLMYSNTATGSGGAIYASGVISLAANTFAANTAGGSGGALYQNGGSLGVTNTIFFSNTAAITGGAVYVLNPPAALMFDYDNFYANVAGDILHDSNVSLLDYPQGAYNILADPRFLNSAANDYHLTAESPGLNSGAALSLMPPIDIEGDARPQLVAWDMGADEFVQVPAWQFDPVAGTPKRTTQATVAYQHVLTNTGNYTDAAMLTGTVDLTDWIVAVSPTSVTLARNMTTTVWVTLTTHAATPLGMAGTAYITATSQANNAIRASAVDVTYYQDPVDLAIGASISPAVWLGNGAPFTYTLVYTNYGPGQAREVVITDILPITMTQGLGFTYTGQALTQRPGAAYSWNVADTGFVSGTRGVVTVTGIVDAIPDVVAWVTNTLTITTEQYDEYPVNDFASVGVRVDSQRPITMGLTPQVAPANNAITYTRANTFNWLETAFDDQTGSGIAGYQFDIRGSGYFTTVTVYTPYLMLVDMPDDVYTWTVRAFDNVGNLGDYVSPFTFTVAVPELSVSKSVTPAVPVAGAPFTYLLTISNTGKIAATGMVLTDALPAGASFVSAPGGGLQPGGVVSWTGLSAGAYTGAVQATLVLSACQPVTNTSYRVAGSVEGVASLFDSVPVVANVVTATVTPSFTHSASPQAGSPVFFTSTATSSNGSLVAWEWDFGDGPVGAGAAINHTFGLSGTYTVTQTVSEVCGVSQSITRSVAVEGTPDVVVTGDPLNVTLDWDQTATRVLTLTNLGTANLQWGVWAEVTWVEKAPHSGVVPPSTSSQIVVTFTPPITAGVYTAPLMIGTNDPDSDPVQVPMTLTVRAPHLTAVPAALSLSRVQGSPATTLSLTIANSGSANLNWSLSEDPNVSWLSASLSGGALSPAASVPLTLTFNVSGLPVAVHTTKLRFASTYPGQAPVEVPVTLTVVSACQPISNPDFSLTPSNPQVGKSVAFNAWTGAGTGPITYAWNFGDGSGSGSGQSLNHTFPSVNTRQTYTVTLTASNACTQPGVEQRKTITVQPYMIYLPAVLRLP